MIRNKNGTQTIHRFRNDPVRSLKYLHSHEIHNYELGDDVVSSVAIFFHQRGIIIKKAVTQYRLRLYFESWELIPENIKRN